MQAVSSPYHLAQSAIAQLKAAIHTVLAEHASDGLRNVDIGRMLGIYTGHVEHAGHISRTLLAIMESEGVVEQDMETKLWKLRTHSQAEPAGND